MEIIFSSTTLGASTKVCLQVLQLVILLPFLQTRQITWPLRHCSKLSPQNLPQRLQLSKATKSSYLSSPSMVTIGTGLRLQTFFSSFRGGWGCLKVFGLDLNIFGSCDAPALWSCVRKKSRERTAELINTVDRSFFASGLFYSTRKLLNAFRKSGCQRDGNKVIARYDFTLSWFFMSNGSGNKNKGNYNISVFTKFSF